MTKLPRLATLELKLATSWMILWSSLLHKRITQVRGYWVSWENMWKYVLKGLHKTNKWFGIYSNQYCMLGGSGGTLRWVPPVYPQGTAGSAVGFCNNFPNQTMSCLITSSNQILSHHITLVKHQSCKSLQSKSNTQMHIDKTCLKCDVTILFKEINMMWQDTF